MSGGPSGIPDDRIVFLLSPPRAGSTLLQRILGATGRVCAPPEPHLLTPLAHLGYWDRVDAAPFDPIVSQRAVRRFVRDLPGGEDDYVDALRAFAGTLYARRLAAAPAGTRLLLDKTPAYALIPDFLVRVFPGARVLVLTRHPAAVFASYARSFFDGDWAAAARFNPILPRYLPPLARLLRERPVALHPVRYEDLVTRPEATVAEVCAFLGIPFDPEVVEYGRYPAPEGGPGDPVGVGQHRHPVPDSVHRWVGEAAGRPDRVRVLAEQIARVSDEDLATWGHPRATFWDPLAGAVPQPDRRTWNRWSAERRLLLWLRRDLPGRPLGRVLRVIRLTTDVLLRDGPGGATAGARPPNPEY